jgi:hypothetical protein
MYAFEDLPAAPVDSNMVCTVSQQQQQAPRLLDDVCASWGRCGRWWSWRGGGGAWVAVGVAIAMVVVAWWASALISVYRLGI